MNKKFPNVSCIYKITSPTNNVYIGKAKILSNRMGSYRRKEEKIKKQKILYNSIIKHGFENHTIEILETLSDYSIASKREIYYITFYNTFVLYNKKGMNLTKGGEGLLGRKMSESEREKIRQRRIGKKMSDETKHRISLSKKGCIPHNRGKKISEQLRNKLSLAKIGKKQSLEHINKCARGHYKKVDIYTMELAFIKTCESVNEAAMWVNGYSVYISKCLKGKKNTYKEYKYKYHE